MIWRLHLPFVSIAFGWIWTSQPNPLDPPFLSSVTPAKKLCFGKYCTPLSLTVHVASKALTAVEITLLYYPQCQRFSATTFFGYFF